MTDAIEKLLYCPLCVAPTVQARKDYAGGVAEGRGPNVRVRVEQTAAGEPPRVTVVHDGGSCSELEPSAYLRACRQVTLAAGGLEDALDGIPAAAFERNPDADRAHAAEGKVRR